jgi:hypothetical protein
MHPAELEATLKHSLHGYDRTLIPLLALARNMKNYYFIIDRWLQALLKFFPNTS